MHSKLLTERCDARHLSSKPQRNWPAKEWQLGLAFISWLYTHTESTWCFMLYHCISILEMLMLRAFTNRNKSYLLALSCRLISCFFFFPPVLFCCLWCCRLGYFPYSWLGLIFWIIFSIFGEITIYSIWHAPNTEKSEVSTHSPLQWNHTYVTISQENTT